MLYMNVMWTICVIDNECTESDPKNSIHNVMRFRTTKS